MIRHKLPQVLSLCGNRICIYNVDGKCDEPQTNRQNSDAACHQLSPSVAIIRWMPERAKRLGLMK